MIGLDTNILARYYIDDDADAEAGKQRAVAQQLIDSGALLAVCKTVLLELEWVMRGYYGFERAEVALVYRHLLAMETVEIEDRVAVERALGHYIAGLDFADALHHASYHDCESMATFDDRRFARRAGKLGLQPTVRLAQ
jgi:predicted nucleic-acid-binding protein